MMRPPSPRPRRAVRAEVLEDRRLLAVAAGLGPLAPGFEANQGQVDAQVQFLARSGGATLFITPTSATLALPTSAGAGTALRMQLVGAGTPTAQGVDPLPGVTNYLAGSAAGGAHLGVASYAAVRERGVYPGVDLTYHASGQAIEYDFTVAPGADPGAIRLQFAGQQAAALDASGDLVLRTAGGDVVEHAPTLYQPTGAGRQAVAGRFTLGAAGQVGFAVGAYDPSRPLVIDPVLGLATLVGAGSESGGHIALDSAGDIYLAGATDAPAYPTTPGAYRASPPTSAWLPEVVVSKFDPTGSTLLYSTYLGPGDCAGLAVDAAGAAYVAGTTLDVNFPTTPGAFRAAAIKATTGQDSAFISKLDPSGSALAYSARLGGSYFDVATGIALDAAGDAFVAGNTISPDFPTTPGAFEPTRPAADRGTQVAFVTEVNPTGSALVYSTYLGSDGTDYISANAIAVTPAGAAVVVGSEAWEYRLADAAVFPTTPGAFQRFGDVTAESNGFVTEFNPAGSGLVYSTYLGAGGTADPTAVTSADAVALDAAGDIYVAGQTFAAQFPTTPGAIATPGSLPFLTKIDPRSPGRLAYSSTFGGDVRSGTVVRALAVDAAGDAILTGRTGSATFPTVDPIQATIGGGGRADSSGDPSSDAFVIEFDPTAAHLLFSTYLGGTGDDVGESLALDPAGAIDVGGATDSADFPTTPGAYGRTIAGQGIDSRFPPANLFAARIVPAVGFAAPAAAAMARAGSALVTVTRDGSTAGAATVTVATSDGTGVAGVDYRPIKQTLTFAPGVASATVAIPLLANGLAPTTRTVNLTLSDPTGALGLGAQATAVLTIVEPTATSTTLVVTPGAPTVGQPVTLLATVAPGAGSAGPPGGTVTFRDGAIVLGTAPLDASGRAALATAALPAGADPVTATYDGDATFAGSSATTVVVVPAPSTTTITSSTVTAAAGQPVGFLAVVAAPGLGAGEPTGSVAFTIDGIPQAPVPLVPSAAPGVATAQLVVPGLAAGSHRVTAAYSGDVDALASTSSGLDQAVTPVAPVAATVALAMAPTIPTAGRPFVLVATTSGTTASLGGPTGTVTFFEGTVPVASIPLDANGQAVLFIPALPAGANQFTAVYDGDASYLSGSAATPTFAAAGPPAPTVGAITRLTATAVAIAFDAPLDPLGAQLAGNYRVATASGRPITVGSATYDATTRAVTLRLLARLDARVAYRLAIVAAPPSGVAGVDGEPLAGAGRAGTNYRGTIPRAAAPPHAVTARATARHPHGPATASRRPDR